MAEAAVRSHRLRDEKVKQLLKALTLARAEIPVIIKDAENPHFKNKYASLSTIIETVTPILLKQGIVVVQGPYSEGDLTGVETTLWHDSGESLSSRLALRPTKNDPQGAGSAITYARRYALSAMLNLATEEDDDGNGALGKKGDKSPKSDFPPQPDPKPTKPPSGSSGGPQGLFAGHPVGVNPLKFQFGCRCERCIGVERLHAIPGYKDKLRDAVGVETTDGLTMNELRSAYRAIRERSE